MDIKQRKKTEKVNSRPTSNQFDKRGSKGEEYHPETFSISKHFPFFSWLCLQYCHYHIQMGKTLRNANVCSTHFVELPTLTFSAYFPLFCLSFLPLIFSLSKYIKNHESQKNIRSYNTVFETTSNHSFPVPNRLYKVKHITQPFKSIERRNSLAVILQPLPPTTESFQNTAKHLRGLFVKILNGFQSLTIFAKSSILDVWQDYEQHVNNLTETKNGLQSIN